MSGAVVYAQAHQCHLSLVMRGAGVGLVLGSGRVCLLQQCLRALQSSVFDWERILFISIVRFLLLAYRAKSKERVGGACYPQFEYIYMYNFECTPGSMSASHKVVNGRQCNLL